MFQCARTEKARGMLVPRLPMGCRASFGGTRSRAGHEFKCKRRSAMRLVDTITAATFNNKQSRDMGCTAQRFRESKCALE